MRGEAALDSASAGKLIGASRAVARRDTRSLCDESPSACGERRSGLSRCGTFEVGCRATFELRRVGVPKKVVMLSGRGLCDQSLPQTLGTFRRGLRRQTGTTAA